MVDIKSKLNEYNKSMITTVDTLKLDDDFTSKTVSLRLGNKVYDLVVSDKNIEVNEDGIREEFEARLTEKRLKIKDSIKSKMAEVSALVSSIQDEYDRKERILKDTLSKSAPMPNVTWEHAKRGLTIVKGGGRGEILFLIKRTYNPKYFDHKNIEPLYVKKLMTNIYIKVSTRDDQILGVSSHYMNTLEYFDHYHQARPDCWGSWKYPSHYKTIEDIIKIADDAIAVMENINPMSIAHRSPSLLPRLETIRRHVLTEAPTAPKSVKVSVTGLREGLGIQEPSQDVWGN